VDEAAGAAVLELADDDEEPLDSLDEAEPEPDSLDEAEVDEDFVVAFESVR
jgi:hypothetical protein